jgi:hypothetical protein
VWTPPLIVGGFAGYYSLGFAYEKGVMAEIDRIAIRILRHKVGYVGLGVVMPTFQWYTAWGVRVTAAAIAAGVCTGVIKIGSFVYKRVKPVDCESKENSVG